MKLNPNQLETHLKNSIALAYWVAGDETLLTIETCNQIRAEAMAQGYTNRRVCHIDNSTDWQEILSGANSLSLFSDKNLLELRFANGKPNAATIKQLNSYFEHANPDTLLLISSPKLDASFQKTKGYIALEKHLQAITLWPVSVEELPRWISGRLRTQGYDIEAEALHILCANVEGNLLAAQQQIMQLVLACEGKTISLELLQEVIANDARFDTYETVDKALNGATAASLRALDGLRDEGLQPASISWIISREIQALISIRHNAKSLGADGALRQARVWKRREPIVRSALKRLKMRDLEDCLHMARELDALSKGQIKGNAWDAMATLFMRIGGISTHSAY